MTFCLPPALYTQTHGQANTQRTTKTHTQANTRARGDHYSQQDYMLCSAMYPQSLRLREQKKKKLTPLHMISGSYSLTHAIIQQCNHSIMQSLSHSHPISYILKQSFTNSLQQVIASIFIVFITAFYHHVVHVPAPSTNNLFIISTVACAKRISIQ